MTSQAENSASYFTPDNIETTAYALKTEHIFLLVHIHMIYIKLSVRQWSLALFLLLMKPEERTEGSGAMLLLLHYTGCFLSREQVP
jgi:hypothetical protein